MNIKLPLFKFVFYVLFAFSLPDLNVQVFAQSVSYDVVIPWDASKNVFIDDQEIFIPTIKNQGYDGKNPFFAWKTKVNQHSDYLISVDNLTFYDASSEDLTFFQYNKIEIPKEPQINSSANRSRTDKFVHVSLNPFVSSSVLGDLSSDWYKISVNQDGIYKLDKAFLTSIGIDVANLNPLHINIYGNGNGKLPELNSVYRPDDLVKNDILVIGESDGSFDASDYILFHAWGPNKIRQVGVEFQAMFLVILSEFLRMILQLEFKVKHP